MSQRIQGLLEDAVGLHQSGRIAEASEIYRSIVAEAPGHFDATHLLGVIALQEGDLDRAQSLIMAALKGSPRDTAALNNLGTVYLRQNRLDLAREQFERAAKAQPNSVVSLVNLGAVLRQLGRPGDALVQLQRAHAVDPASVVASNLLGACLLDVGEFHEAVKIFGAATAADPNDADGWGNLAVALNSIGDRERARDCADRAIAMRPSSSTALAARASVEFEQGKVGAAVATYLQAVSLPDASSQTLCALANALWISGRCQEALDYLRRALEVDANNAMARWKLAVSECRTFYDNEAEILASRHAFAASLEQLRAWFRASPRPAAFAAVGSTQPFYIAYQPFNNRELLSQYGDLCSEWMASLSSPTPAARLRAADGKIRVGIASAHVRNHSVWNAITRGWVRHLDKTRFEIHIFQLGGDSDEETSRARLEVAHFESGPKNLQGWIRAIGDARLDVLIYPEIGMDALAVQLASLRLAPVQAATWGHAEGTGLPTIDMYLSAEGIEPPNAQDNYREKLVRLPNLGVYVEPLTPPAADPDLVSLGLSGDRPLLLCPGSPFKYSPVYDHVWASIADGLRSGGGNGGWSRLASRLRGKRNGVLVFFRCGNDSMDGLFAGRLRRAFEAQRVDFDDHVRVLPHLDRPRFFGLMQRATLMLDTVGFSGFNNAIQAVETGLPVLAHEGNFMRGRLASGIMRRMDIPELVATTDDEFIGSAVGLALDASRCRDLRDKIEARRSVLFCDIEPVRALERCLTEAVARVNSGQRP